MKKLEKNKSNVPLHVAIIPDGNRRWAVKKGFYPSYGHYKAGSYDNLERLFGKAKSLGVKYLSIWGFSTENWKRDKKEIKSIFDLILKGIDRFKKEAHKSKIRFRHFGRKDRLPKKLLRELEKLEEETENYSLFNVNLCLDYGGRDEILRCVNLLLKDKKKNVDERDFSAHLDSKGVPDPDLIIRTSGEKRISGFMPFQSTYAEFSFVNKHFPDFTGEDLKKEIDGFSMRQRRMGE